MVASNEISFLRPGLFSGALAVSFSNYNVSLSFGHTLIKQSGRWQYSQIHHANGSLDPPKKTDAKFVADFFSFDPKELVGCFFHPFETYSPKFPQVGVKLKNV